MEISNVHHQAMASHHQLEEVLGCPKVQRQQPQQQQQLERKPRPHPEQALKCPRCDSTNTKFCYYNNYSLSQPRYFCKGCRRYWTQGGSLRNVPVGGGCRKNKRSSSSSSSSSSSCSKRQQDHQDHNPTTSNLLLPDLIPPPPPFSYDPNDLSLAFASIHKQQPTRQLGMEESNNFLLANPNSTTSPLPTAPAGSFLDILRSGFLDTNNQSGFQSLYSGFGGNGDVQVETGVGGEEAPQLRFEGGLSGATTPTTTDSQGSCKVVDGGESKVLPMAHQWQVAGDGNLVMDSGRDYWNGLGSSWHGLINSSLM